MLRIGFNRLKALVVSGISSRRAAFPKVNSALGQPVVAFGAVLLLLIWAGTAVLLFEDSRALQSKAERDAVNFARVAQQNAAGKLSAVFEQLRLLRWLDVEQAYKADWPVLLADADLVAIEDVQVSVVDNDGFVAASTSKPYPVGLVSVGAQPFFKAQHESTSGGLYVGAATAGPDGRMKMNISARRGDPGGPFYGAFVFSFPTDYFERYFDGLDLGAEGGLALIGDDGAIRTGSGVFADRAGQSIVGVYKELGDGFSDQQRIRGWPLVAVSRVSGLESNPGWRRRRAMILAGAVIASILTLAATIRVARRRTEFEREILHLSRHDSLTGLPNRHSLSRELDRLCAANDVIFALHVLDLDRFKLVNDTYGHLVGDELLQLASERLRQLLRGEDMVARLGGDEFAVLQRIGRVENFETDAMALARRIVSTMAEPFVTSRSALSIGATVGVACSERDGDSAVELMKAADLALYAAKGDGRGCARAYRRAMSETTTARVDLEIGLRRALGANEFHLVYQPIHALRRPGLIGYEALLRWRRPDGRLIPPDAFIPVAENLGLIIDIGAWALRRACLDIAALPGDLDVSVNVSATQLDAGRLVGDVDAALRASRLAPKRLRIEITESALLRDRPIVAEQIRALREMGVGLSLDDFGAGYSCLSYLEMYPIDTLKIDQRFVRKLGERVEAAATLRAIVDLARSYGMKTVGEGVETEEQLKALRELGCERAQGYLLGRPGPLPNTDATTFGTAA